MQREGTAVQVAVSWGTSVLRVDRMTPKQPYFVDEEDASADAKKVPLLVPTETGIALLVRASMKGEIVFPGGERVVVPGLGGKARPSAEHEGAWAIDLPEGARAAIVDGVLRFDVTVSDGDDERVAPVPLLTRIVEGALPHTGVSFAVHAGLLAMVAFLMPPLGADASEEIDRDRLALMQRLLDASAVRETEQREDPLTPAHDEAQGGGGGRAPGDEGGAGKPLEHATNRRYALQGPPDTEERQLARAAALQEVVSYGVLGYIATLVGDPNAPTAPWGHETALGNEEQSARGNLFGATIGDAAGMNGLGLSGVGEGGGCLNGGCTGIGIGNIGPLGHGAGPGVGPGVGGIGQGRGPGGGGHVVKAPRMTCGNVNVHGHIPPEVIQRIVRQNFGRFRLCYEDGLRTSPTLQGRVAVKFMIDRTGAVSLTADGGSDLPDQRVVQCVVRGFGNLSFPAPDDGAVSVVYPIVFQPGG